MSKIELETKAAFGYGLVIFGVILLVYTYIQAGITVGNLMAFIGEIMPNPTLVIYSGQATEIPGFAETLSWFFMLLIQTLIGFFIATIGIRSPRQKLVSRFFLFRYSNEFFKRRQVLADNTQIILISS